MRTFPGLVGLISPLLLASAIASCTGGDGPTPARDAGSDAGRHDGAMPEPEPDAGDYEASTPDVHRPKLDGSTRRCSGDNGIEYCGGPVIAGSLGVYLLWYGSWPEQRKALIREFVAGLSGSPWMAIDKGYCDEAGACVSGDVDLRGEADLGWKFGDAGTSWGDTKIEVVAMVADQVAAGTFPADPGAVFVAMIGAEQRASDGPCLDWCGWHDRFALDANDVKIAAIWDPSACPDACTAFTWVLDAGGHSPNDDLGADGIASILAHELAEAASDPDLNAWTTGDGFWENADLCGWTFGQTYAAMNGAPANVRLGARDWLVQRNWANADGGYCTMGAP